MPRLNPGRALAAIVGAIAVLNTVSAFAMPVRDWKADPLLIVTWLCLLLAHAAVYFAGDRIRARWGLGVYTMAQGTLLFAVALSGAQAAVTIGIFMAATAELVVLAEAQGRWSTTGITLGAILLFVLAALLTSDLYRATTAGLLLAVTGLVTHAFAALVQRRGASAEAAVPAVDPPASVNGGAARLSARELDVLRQLVTGARNSDIAARLGISERTVKAHLGSIYQKLGVETRSAAVATAVERKLV